MKKYLVIGNPIEHSLSPQLHNYWIKIYKINAVYEKKKIESNELGNLISDIRNKKISGLNVTIPFKQEVIPYLDKLSNEAKKTQSVNTVYLEDNKTVGHNTDVEGFQESIRHAGFDIKGKNILILGAGGVVPSIIFALENMGVSNITICNRTKEKAVNLKKIFNNIKVLNWGDMINFDVIINATSIGLDKEDKINLDFSKIKNKFFYDVIYNPSETDFLKSGKKFNNKTLNGKMMFIYQALFAFKTWHKILPKINDKVIKVLEND